MVGRSLIAVAFAATWCGVVWLGDEPAPVVSLIGVASGVLLLCVAVPPRQAFAPRASILTDRAVLRAGFGACATAAIADVAAGVDVSPTGVATAALAATGAALLVRFGLSTNLRRLHRRGRLVRDVIVMADDHHADRLFDLVAHQESSGWRLRGAVGDCREVAARHDVAHLGSCAQAVVAAVATGSTVVIAAASALHDDCCHEQLHELRARGIDVRIDPNLAGFDVRHLRVTALQREPLLELTAPNLRGFQLALKRTTDVVVAATLLILTAPLLGAAAVAIRLGDRGPVLFRQHRVGRDGATFVMPKLRTMTIDAEARKRDLLHLNERDGGPLFKVADDPRVTRIGRVLRATSIDELPQLVSVLRGHMSLVGPRPALPDEVATFDARLTARHRVRPGLTGLWQVEQRDNGSFEAYRRLDLFYVDNWTLLLDLTILLHTAPAVARRGWRALRHRPPATVPATAVPSASASELMTPPELVAS